MVEREFIETTTRKYNFNSLKAAVAVARRQGVPLKIDDITRDTHGRRMFQATVTLSAESAHGIEDKRRVFQAGFDFEIDVRRAIRNARRIKPLKSL